MADQQKKMQQKSFILFLCPSLYHNCGIARYTNYAIRGLREVGVDSAGAASLTEAEERLADTGEGLNRYIILQHEYGLFDYLNQDLSTGMTTFEILSFLLNAKSTKKVKNVAIVMHTLVNNDHVLSLVNKQIFSSGINIYHLNKEGCNQNGIDFIEHGVHQERSLKEEKEVT